MPSRAYTSFLQRRIRSNRDGRMGVNALSGLSCYALAGGIALSSTAFQCPLGLISHFYRYPFKNLGFMRFPEPVFVGIYQNILTTAVFRAC